MMGDDRPITRSEARKILDALARLRLQAIPPLVYDEVHQAITLASLDDLRYIRLTAGDGGGYAWEEVYPDPAGGGGFLTGRGRSRPDDLANELNYNPNLCLGGKTPIVECWRDNAGALRFRASLCPNATP